MLNKEEFRHPGVEFRSVPFSSWNDNLRDEELIRQINEMKDKGWGGWFMHARSGLMTPYLSEAWMKRIMTCVNEAKRIGSLAWLYDEDKWQSGYAGGIVPRKGIEYRHKFLECLLLEGKGFLTKKGDGQIVKVFTLRGKEIEDVTEKELDSFNPMGRKLLCFIQRTLPMNNPFFNGTTYVDTLDPKVVDSFIQSTYEAYYERLRKDFGKTVPGIFTDEPNYYVLWSQDAGRLCTPWTNDFPSYFRSKSGYSILDHLPSIFFDIGNFRKIRRDFWSTLTELFVESFTKRIYCWCNERNLKFTGHFLEEDSLSRQIKAIGAAMPHYEYMHIPGMDHLGKNIENVITAKQVSSVAHQLQRKRVLCEMYGGSGQDLSFEDRKWIGDWHLVLGINLINLHLSHYSMRGKRKRDWPPTLSYQQPWWRYNKLLADYFARLSYCLTRGEHQTDILLLHPIETGWATFKPQDTTETDTFNNLFVELSQDLLAAHHDYDYGDEKLMEKYGIVENATLKVGRCPYQIVIIPPCLTLRRKTIKLLDQFIENGGTVIAVKPLPSMIEGQEKDLSSFLSKTKVLKDRNELIRTLSLLHKRGRLEKAVDIVGEKGTRSDSIWYHYRQTRTEKIYFLVNTDRHKEFNTTVELKGEGVVERWSPVNGKIQEISFAVARNGYFQMPIYFRPAGSHLVVIRRRKNRNSAKEKRSSLRKDQFRGQWRMGISLNSRNVSPLKKKWHLKRKDPNALTLDYCEYRLGQQKQWNRTIPVWRAHNIIRQNGRTPHFFLKYVFELDLVLQKLGEIYLVMETPERFTIAVNEKEIAYQDIGYWQDISFKKINIKNAVRKGENQIVIEGKLKEDTELESCYIIGDFEVHNKENKKFKITPEKKEVRGEDLVKEGYPFFSGTVLLAQVVEIEKVRGERVFLTLDRLHATVARVLVNGRSAGHILWRPYHIEITRLVKLGTNLIEIEIINSLRNLLGPHHNKQKELHIVFPESFTDEENWVDAYNFVKYGVEGVTLYRCHDRTC